MDRPELTLATCRELADLGDSLSAADLEERADAALKLSEGLAHYGLSIGSLLRQRHAWGARPDLSRSCHALARYFADEVLPVGESLGWNSELLAEVDSFAIVDGPFAPADLLRVLGLFAMAQAEVMNPSTGEPQSDVPTLTSR